MTEPGSGVEQKEPDTAAGDGLDPSRHGVHRRKVLRSPWFRRGMIGLAATLVVLLVLGVMAYLKFSGNITALDVTKLLGKRPSTGLDLATDHKPLNILVMGSDTRALGGTTAFGTTAEAGGARSDTTLLVHLSGDRRSAVVVSIPRDSMTRAPGDCKNPNSTVANGPIRQWNTNFALGGPACLIRTFEGNTGIFVDHFMVVNFLGFQSMVDALGSVEVCVPTAINDDYSNLHLPAGRSQVNGTQALAFVRARHNIGNDASDIGRINRQQAFLSAMVQEATSSKMLFRPDKLFRFLDAATKSLTTDPAMANPNALRDVTQSLSGLASSQVRFVTVPFEDYPPDRNRVQWSSDSKFLWKSIRGDTPLPGSKPVKRPSPAATKGPALKIRPDQITVQVSNASGYPGSAEQAASDLRIQGFHVDASQTSPVNKEGVSVAYSKQFFEQARTVAAAFPGATLVKDETVGPVIQVTLGAGSPFVVAVPNRLGSTPLPKHSPATTPTPTVTIKSRAANSNICGP